MILNLSCGFFFTYFENKTLKYMNYTILHTFTVQTFIVPQNYTGEKKQTLCKQNSTSLSLTHEKKTKLKIK